MPFATVNGLRLYYERSGAGEPVVLVHGSWLDCCSWGRVVPRLVRGLEVVAYDRRGHSRSESARTAGSVEEDSEDLAALIEALGVAPAHIAGVSWGGSIALRVAATHPDLVRSASLHEPPLFDLLDAEAGSWQELGELRSRLAGIIDLLEAGEFEAGARRYVEEVAAVPGAWEGLSEDERRTRIRNAATYLDQCRDPEQMRISLEELRAFRGPAMITYGDRRPPLFRRIVEIVAGALPGARVKLLAGTAHDPQATHPGAYAAALSDFVAVGDLATAR
jgi:pimeloyl-ACP methyl ester carboxylesterase